MQITDDSRFTFRVSLKNISHARVSYELEEPKPVKRNNFSPAT